MIPLALALMIVSDPLPVAGRPVDFSGAVGGPFTTIVGVDKSEVKVGEPITLTLQIKGAGDYSALKRPDLRQVKAIADRFVVDDGPMRELADPIGREFVYTLRPINSEVDQIPRLQFVYFNPQIKPAERGWQTTNFPPYPIRVIPAGAVPDHAPASFNPLLRPENRWYPDFLLCRIWNWVALACFAAIPIVIHVIPRLGTRWRCAIVALLIGGWMVPLVNSLVEESRRSVNRTSPRIATSHDTALRTGNGVAYPEKMQLPRGVECRRIGERSGWLQVEFASGLAGWIPKEHAIVIDYAP